MPISDSTADREHGKFVEVSGNPVVRVANADGSAISAGGGGGTSMVDDAAFTPAGSSVTPIGAFADESSPDLVDEGDVGAVRMTLRRALHVNLRDASGAEISPGAGVEYTEGDTDASITGKALLWEDGSDTLRAVSAAKPLPVAQTGGLPAGSNNIGDVDVLTAPDVRGISNVTVQVTNSGQTQVIAAPGVGQKLRVWYFAYSLSGSSAVTASLRPAAGADRYTVRLQSQGAAFAHNIRPGYWDLAENTALQATLSGASQVEVSLDYETVAV